MKAVTGNLVFGSLGAREAAIETELRPLWTEPARVRQLVGHGWIRSQVNASSS